MGIHTMKIPFAALIVLSLVLAGCASVPTATLKSQIMAADTAFSADAANEGMEAAFLKVVAPEGRLLGANGRGAQAVHALYGHWPAGGTISWTPDFADVAASGDLGYTLGHYVVTVPAPKGGTSKREKGNYVTLWRRQPDGSWKVVVDGGS